jgi:uncharacterized protein (DUF169 family)
MFYQVITTCKCLKLESPDIPVIFQKLLNIMSFMGVFLNFTGQPILFQIKTNKICASQTKHT